MKKIDLTVLVSLGALWGGSFLFMRMGADAFGALPLAGLRAIGAALCFLPLLASRRRLAEWRAHWWPIAVVGVANSALPFLLFTFATRSLPAGLASIIDGMTPMFAALIGWLWLGQRLDAWRGAGRAAGFAGILWLGEGSLALAPGAGLALLACVAATVLYGYSVHYTRLRLDGVTPLVVTVGSHLVAALALLPTTLLAWPTQAPPLQAWLAAAGLAVLCTALAYVLFFWVLARVGAQRIMVIPYLIPAFGVAWGGLLLDEPVTMRMLGGCAVILLGTALTTGLVGPRRRSPRLAAGEA
ncbi:DMT family transporter [Frateuria sp. STR12]|uniref:DMT family transporter n=1 Tax=Frateuria hangzhouensis TaxID=2995589 RepID=UPI002260CE54|nr:DMT family transporter [Frateuria sp. STR12]MCX7514466.1 DMT family transporter [Frateuria sp. STR12]